MTDRSVRTILSVNATNFIAGFRQAGNEVRTLQTVMRGLNVPDALLRDIRLIGSTLSGQLNNVHALRTALLGIGLPAGGLAGSAAMQRQIADLEAQIRRLRSTAGAPIPLGPTPSHPSPTGGSSSASGSSGSGISAADIARVAAYAGGFLALGSAIKSTYTATADYETEINTFGAVTKASADQLKQASALAIQLGGDVTIAGASAADAAAVLVELAKGGMNVQSSFEAAKGTLQLASAATVSVGTAAAIQTAALNGFGLAADQAGKVADILSNTAAAASGEITDFAAGTKYAMVSAHQLGLTLTETQTALGLLAQAGMKGSMAGTNFNDVLVRAQPLTKKTKQAMDELGVSAFNSAGEFEGLPKLIDQLRAAHQRLSPAAFESANKIAFGLQGMRASGIFAGLSADAYNDMFKAIDQGSGVVAFSTAKMSGLGGAFLNVKNQIETAQVTLGEKFSPALQTAMAAVSRAIPIMTGFLTGSQLGGGFDKIGDFFKPIVSGAGDLISKAWPYVQTFIGSIGRGFQSVVTFVKPVADAIGAFFHAIATNGTVATFGSILTGIGKGFEGIFKFIEPAGKAIGDAIKWFTRLGPIATTAAVALGAMVLLKGPLFGMFGAVGAAAGRAATQISIFATTGLATNLGNAARNAGRSLLGMFGGPWGLAIVGATTALALFMGRTKDATITTHDFTGAIDDNTGALTQNAAQQTSEALKDTLVAFKNAGGDVKDYTDAVMGNIPAQARVTAEIKGMGVAAIEGTDIWKKFGGQFEKAGITSNMVADALTNGGNALTTLKQKYVAAGLQTTLGDFSTGLGSVGGALTSTSDIQKQYGADQAKFADDLNKGKVAAEASGAAMKLLGETHKETAGGMSQAWDTAGSAIASSLAATAPPVKTVAQIMADSLKLVSDAAATAATQVSIFQETMDKLNGIDTSVVDSQRISAAAIRDIGKAYRDQAAAVTAAADAKAKYQKDLGNLGKKNADGTAASDATTAADVQADSRAIIQTQQDVAAAFDNTAQKIEDSRKTVEAEAQSTGKAALAQGGFAAGLKATIGVYKQRHDEFVKQIVDNRAAGVSVADATKAAEAAAKAQGLVVDKQKITAAFTKANLDAAALYGQKMAAAAKKAADAVASHKATMQFGADLSAAKAAFKEYGGLVSRMPKEVKTKFNAEVAEAETHGLKLYRVYNATSGKWTAVFETPNAAGAQSIAGTLVQEYNKADGTWTSNFDAVTAAAKQKTLELAHAADIAANERTLILRGLDYASAHIQAVKDALSGIQDKTVTLTVNAVGQSVSVSSDGSFTSGSGAKGHADGGYISGPGGPTTDSVAARLSNGEFVVKASATSRHRSLLESINRGYANGGFVNTTAINMLGTGNIDNTVKSVAGIYSNAASSATSINAAAVKAAASAPPASSAGVQQWAGLATQALTMLGQFSPTHLAEMLHQMDTESSGNPAAINLYDINAQNGVPSKGLMQVIDPTFRANAIPGYNTNIWDPLSNMLASINYVMHQYGSIDAGYRGVAYANGGYVSGAGGSKSDSIAARLSNGEFVVNAQATSKNLPLLSAMNGKGYASGGAVGSVAGSALGLSGRAAFSPGAVDSLVIQAIQDIAATVAAARAAADGMRQKAAGTATALQAQLQAQIDNPKQALANLKAAQKVQASENSKTTARQRIQDAARVASAAAAYNKIKQTDALNVLKATREHDAAVKNAVAYGKAATAAEKAQKAQQGLYHTQQAYAAHLDQLGSKLTDAQANLATLQGNKASAASGIASTVSGFDGGITGHSDTRGTYATILQGQKYDLAQAKKFQANLATLKKNGLNSATLSQIANAGIDGGGVTAAALAKASPAQLKALNATTGAITGVAGSIGQSVSGAMYDAGIQAATGLVNGLKSQMGAIQKVMNGIATSVISTLTKKLQIHSPSKVMDGHGRNTVLGYINGLNAMGPQVSDVMAGMLTIPAQPQRQLVSVSAGPQLDSRIAAGVQKAMDGWSFSIVQDPRGAWKVVQQGQKTSSRFGGRS